MSPVQRASASLILLLALVTPAGAQETAPSGSTPSTAAPSPAAPVEETKPAPYDAQLARLSEVLGSIHYLRALCGGEDGDWRQSMQELLDADTINEPQRRERLTAAFNRGYRSFASVHTVCTDAARMAEERHRNEGATLAAEIAARFGN
ncbi:MAG: TIGR02301 family protein [Pseudorhizobium sp.]